MPLPFRTAFTPIALLAVAACGESPGMRPTPVSSAPPAPVVVTLTQMSLDPPSVVSGEASQGTVSLSIADPAGGTVVRLTSSHPGATVPSQVTVPTGALFVTFPITTSGVVGTAIDAAITASLGTSTRSETLRVLPTPPKLIRLVVQSLRGYVELDLPALPGGASVAMRTDDPAISVTNPVLVPEGRLTGEFSYSGGRAQQRITFIATYRGVSESTSIILPGRPFPFAP